LSWLADFLALLTESPITLFFTSKLANETLPETGP